MMENSLVSLARLIRVDSENVGQVVFQLRTIREYLDKIDDEDVQGLIQWQVKDDWKSDRININHASLGNGNGLGIRDISNGSNRSGSSGGSNR